MKQIDYIVHRPLIEGSDIDNPTHFHKGNLGNTIPLKFKDGKFYWKKDGKIEQWYGNVNNRDWTNPASVDGEIIDGKEVPYSEGETFASRQKSSTAKPEEKSQEKSIHIVNVIKNEFLRVEVALNREIKSSRL